MKNRFWLLVCASLMVGFVANVSSALPQFKKAFQKKYIDESDNDELKAAFKKAGCNTCHVKGQKEKSPQNDYGILLAELIEGDAKDRLKAAKENGTKNETLEQILEELEEAFKEVEEEEAPSGGNFGERIKNGQLPVDLPKK